MSHLENLEGLAPFLAREPALYIDMLEGLRRRTAVSLRADAQGALVYNAQADVHMLCSENLEAAERLLEGMAIRNLVVHEMHALGAAQRRGLQGTLRYHHAAYLQANFPPAEGGAAQCRLQALDERHAAFVASHYHSLDGTEYVYERIRAGMMTGAFWYDQLAGFIGEHDEGAIGMLEVLPAYRRGGVAYALERDAICRALNAGKWPYCQVVEGNEASLRLQGKLGFTISAPVVTWMVKEREH